MATVSMSKQAFSRLELLLRVRSDRLRVADASALLGLRRPQVLRLLRGLMQGDPMNLRSKHRGKPSSRRPPAEVRGAAMSIVRGRYVEFGPTLAPGPEVGGPI